MTETLIVPISYSTLAALFFGGQVFLTIRSFNYVDPQTSSMIAIGTCVAIFWLMAPFKIRTEYFLNPGILIFIANGLIHPLFSMYLYFEANKRMGPTVSATIASTSPLFSAVGAVFLLGEHLTMGLLTGILLTVAGIMVLSYRRRGSFNWALGALFFPTGAAIIRAVNHIIGKFGLETLPSPFFASIVSFTVSFMGALLIYRFRIGKLPLKLPRKGLKWSALAGVCISIGVLFMYNALHKGMVIVVSPIIATTPLFTFLLSLLFRQEVLSKRLLIGIILVVGGIIWITLQ